MHGTIGTTNNGNQTCLYTHPHAPITTISYWSPTGLVEENPRTKIERCVHDKPRRSNGLTVSLEANMILGSEGFQEE